MDWINIIVSILSGLAVCIPLAAKLVSVVKQAVREKNWSKLVKLVMSLMEDAETMFDTGAQRKEWVLGGIESMADSIDCEVDMDVIGKLIDSLCELTKHVNTGK